MRRTLTALALALPLAAAPLAAQPFGPFYEGQPIHSLLQTKFARLARKHPEAMRRFVRHRVARPLKLVPLRQTWRALCAWLAREDEAPLSVRRVALKMYRASYYAEHLP